MVSILDLIFPRRCAGCKKVGKYICTACQKMVQLQVRRCPECDKPAMDGKTHPVCLKRFGLDGLTTVFRYDGIVKKVIKSIKYRFIYDMAATLIDLIPQDMYHSLFLLPKNAVIYPIPLHQDRLRWRGFNQAEKLGQILAKRLNMQIVEGLLIRQEKRMPQADIKHRSDRIKNAQGLFILKSIVIPDSDRGSISIDSRLRGNDTETTFRSILLLDDVWTTGATMKEAAKVLKRGGVKFVWGITMAR